MIVTRTVLFSGLSRPQFQNHRRKKYLRFTRRPYLDTVGSSSGLQTFFFQRNFHFSANCNVKSNVAMMIFLFTLPTLKEMMHTTIYQLFLSEQQIHQSYFKNQLFVNCKNVLKFFFGSDDKWIPLPSGFRALRMTLPTALLSDSFSNIFASNRNCFFVCVFNSIKKFRR